MNGLDLFSGIGGISKALERWVKPVIYCEIDPYCQGVLLSRMADESLSDGPIWDDITTLSGLPFNGSIDIIYGGFPCQDISVAGNGKGLVGKRSGLFYEVLRLAKEIKPKFIFLENVPAITSRGASLVISEITSLGYDCRWCVISAASVGALHRRERWFLLAKLCHTNGVTSEQTDQSSSTKCASGKARNDDSGECWPFESRDDWQKTVREMGKCSNGISNQMDRLRSLGNSVVPAQVKEAFQILMGIK